MGLTEMFLVLFWGVAIVMALFVSPKPFKKMVREFIAIFN
jgi:hypothetical protein